jgi:hypothetical protein
MQDIYDFKPKAIVYFSLDSLWQLPEDWSPWFYEPLRVVSARRPMVNRKKTDAINLILMNPMGRILEINEVSCDWAKNAFVTDAERIPTPMGLIERGYLHNGTATYCRL